MTENMCSEFCIDISKNRYQLPVDSSATAFETALKNEGIYFSRKSMCKMMKDLPIVKGNEKSQSQTLYDYLNNQRFESYEKSPKDDASSERFTYNLPIYWEIQDLLKALCAAKSTKRTLKEEALAEKALALLVDAMKEKSVADIKRKYTDVQLLKETYVRTAIIQKYRKHIGQRLDIIYDMTLRQSADIAAKTMQLAFPALDALVVELLQVDRSTDETAPSSALDCIQSYFKRLMNARPQHTENHRGSVEFKCDGHTLEMKALENQLNKLVGKTKISPEELLSATKAYEQYLFNTTEAQPPNKERDAYLAFVDAYDKLDTYINTNISWNRIEQIVNKELRVYAQTLFNDITNREYMPYDVSDFPQDHAPSAFISERCKNAHNRIRAMLHKHLRLLMEKEYLVYFHPHTELFAKPTPLEPYLTEKYMQDLSTLLQPQLQKWLLSARRASQFLSNECKYVPSLITCSKKAVALFVDQFNSGAASFFDMRPISKSDLARLIYRAKFETLPLVQMFNMSELLLLESRMAAYLISDQIVQEIKVQYEMLKNIYNR